MAAALIQCLGCVCGCLLALLIALNLTIFREGYYIHKLDKSTCLQQITDNVLEAGRTVAQAAQIRQDILDPLVTQEDVRVAVVRRADEIWHGGTTQPDTPYVDLVAYLQDTITAETGVMWDEAVTQQYTNIRLVCEDMWRTNAVPPMANILNLLMQYRRSSTLPAMVLAGILLLCLWLQVPLSRNWRQLADSLFAIGAGIVFGAVLAMLAVQLSGWQSWMAVSDPAYELYKAWFGGFPPVLAACGSGLAGLVWLLGLLPYTMAVRAEKRKRRNKDLAARSRKKGTA